MKPPFLSAIDDHVLVCDGAMGTELYAKGVFINQCFDALNVTEPDRVLEVHRDYVQAGADVLETNTFGANRIKLRGFGLADRLREINVAGVRLARRAATDQVYVAGAMGPLGIRIEPWGKTGHDEAQGYFEEQVEALVEGGVDVFMLETFRDVNELRAAIAAVRAHSTLPVVAQMTIEEDGHSLDGASLEQFVPALRDSGADVIGINCRIGPAHMLEAMERIAALTGARLSAQPNAGQPRDIEGRTIYLTSPEYMASYARRFLAHGVRLVGGCCGTTPEHIRQIKATIGRSRAPVAPAAPARESVVSHDRVIATEVGATGIPRAEKSGVARALATGQFVQVVEVVPPRGHAADEVLDVARRLRLAGIDAVQVADRAGSARVSALSFAVLLQERTGIEAILQYACRDRHLLGMQSDLLGAHAMGIRNVVLVTGDPRSTGDYPDAGVVFDVDSIGLANMVSRLNLGLDVGGQTIGRPTAFHIGVTVNPDADDLEHEIRRFDYKVAAGAELVVTTPVYDVASFERLHARIASAGLPILLGLWPLESALGAEFMANEVPGTTVPAHVVERMRRAAPDAAAAEGVAIAGEIARALKGAVQGLHVRSSSDDVDLALRVLESARN